MKEDLKELYLGWEIDRLENRLDEKKGEAEAAKVIVRTIEEDRKLAYEKTKGSDVGMTALKGLKGKDLDIAQEIEEEMKAEGIL
jgi:hypothetical protein